MAAWCLESLPKSKSVNIPTTGQRPAHPPSVSGQEPQQASLLRSNLSLHRFLGLPRVLCCVFEDTATKMIVLPSQRRILQTGPSTISIRLSYENKPLILHLSWM